MLPRSRAVVTETAEGGFEVCSGLCEEHISSKGLQCLEEAINRSIMIFDVTVGEFTGKLGKFC